MSQSVRHQSLLALLAAVLFLTNLGATHLWDVDEAIFSQAAKEMFERGDYVVPYFNGQVFPDKPAMMYWLMIGAYKTFGTTEFAARFFSAVAGIGSVLLTYRIGRMTLSPRAGLWAALVLATCFNFNLIARAATPDALLTFFTTLAIYLFVRATAVARAPGDAWNERNAPWVGQRSFAPSWRGWALVYAAMAAGVLTKGPIGVVLPTAILGLFLLAMRAGEITPSPRPDWVGAMSNSCRWLVQVFGIRNFFSTLWSMRPMTAIAVVLAVAGPWYTWVGMRTDGQWLIGFFGVHNFGRFLGAMENHRGPIFYYVLAMAAGFFPWSVLFGPLAVNFRRQAQGDHAWRPAYALACSWLAVWVGFFSLAGTKLPSYVIPAYPALALLMGAFVDVWLRDANAMSRLWARLVWGTTALAGIAVAIALPVAAHLYLHDDWMLGAVGLLPIVAAVAGWIFTQRQQTRYAAAALGTLGAALSIAVLSVGAVWVDRYQDSYQLAGIVQAHKSAGETVSLGSYRYFRPSMVFYNEQPIAQFGEAAEIGEFFASHASNAFLITTDDELARLDQPLPAGVTVLARQPRFLRPGNAVLVGRATESNATAAGPRPSDSGPRQQY